MPHGGRFPEAGRLRGDVVAPLFAMKQFYSSHPQFRVHLARSPSASTWHTDQQVTGRADQISIWLPIVSTCVANTLWVETDYGRRDYTPVTVEYSQMLLFDGGRAAEVPAGRHLRGGRGTG